MSNKYFGCDIVDKIVVSDLGKKYYIVLKDIGLMDNFTTGVNKIKSSNHTPMFKILLYEYKDLIMSFPNKKVYISEEMFKSYDSDYIKVVRFVIDNYEIENYKKPLRKFLEWDGEF